jgi:hypothetical protein
MTTLGKATAALAALACAAGFATPVLAHHAIKRVLLISIDGMHALDFQNCANGVGGGESYCPNMANLANFGTLYTEASTSRPSDSFPGLTAIVTGASPRTTGAFYDVSYSRALSPPAQTTPYGIPGGACPGTVGTQIGYDEEIDIDLTKLNAGGGINPAFLPRDPRHNCAPVYPHQFINTNTIFEVVRAAGGYTGWFDKHQSYEIVKGPSGEGVNDFWAPEINSIPVPIPVTRIPSLNCSPLPDQTHVSSSDDYTKSFQNVQCYDGYKAQGILNQIDGLDHTGTANKPVPTLFGMNFQAVSVGQKLVEKSLGLTGGYLDAAGTPRGPLKNEIRFVDRMIGRFVSELDLRGLLASTAIIITAKHGQSPIDPASVYRITGDTAANPAINAPSTFVSTVQADEDDISLLWLADRSPSGLAKAVETLEKNRHNIGADGGEIFYGPSLALMFDPNNPSTPDIVVAPNVGVIYTGGQSKIAEHGGFAHDDTNVMMLISNPNFNPRSVTARVTTAQVAPTVLKLLDLDPALLQATHTEGIAALPGF